MHIPDGYLGPRTYVAAYAVMAPLWAIALRRVERTVRMRQIPLLALGAAFCFVIMMFNVPIPGGSTGHAAGGVLVAILLGPWAAVVSVSLALIVQALLFGDGGVTAIGANCLNMAVIMPLVGWWVYELLAGRSAPASGRRAWAAAVGGYVGLNAAALSAGVMFGLQPHLAHDAAGRALYCPFGLSVAVPAMAIGHLLVFGWIEAAVTGLVVAYVQRSEPAWLAMRGPSILTRRLAWGLFLLVLLTPLGLYLPKWAGAGSAWGEWSVDEIASAIGYTPERLARIGSLWQAPFVDYAWPGRGDAAAPESGFAYAVSAVLGVALLCTAAWGVRVWSERRSTGEKHS